MTKITEDCSESLKGLQTCEGELECEKAMLAKDVCVARVACPKVATAFMKVRNVFVPVSVSSMILYEDAAICE